jgi:hypothetical protein
MTTKCDAAAPTEPTAVDAERSGSPRKPNWPFIWDHSFSPEGAASTLLQFTSGNIDIEDPERADAVVEAWEALSRVVAEEYDVAQEAASFTHLVLMHCLGGENVPPAAALDDPDVDAAVRVAIFALSRIAWSWRRAKTTSDEAESVTLRKMAALLDPLGSADPKTRRRQQIKGIVEWSASEDENPRTDWVESWEEEDGGAEYVVPDEEWRARRAAYLREELGKLDARLALDEATARTLVRLFKHKNGTQRLAANWAWRAGFEGEPWPGESLSGDAPERVVDRYRDVEQKLSSRRRRRKKQA